MEHPQIKMVNQKGYLEEKPESCGDDAMGTEIFVGDDIVLDPYGEIVLEDNLEDYLIERLGFVFKKAE